MEPVAESFNTDKRKYFFYIMYVNFWHLLPQEVVETERIQDFDKFVDSRSIKWNKRTSKGYTL